MGLEEAPVVPSTGTAGAPGTLDGVGLQCENFVVLWVEPPATEAEQHARSVSSRSDYIQTLNESAVVLTATTVGSAPARTVQQHQ